MGLRWRFVAVCRWKFYTGAFLAKLLVRFSAQFSTLGGIFQELNINFEFSFPKRFDPCVRLRHWAIARENLPGGLTCRSVNKKGIYNTRKILIIFHLFAENPPMDGFARNFITGGHLADVITCFKFCVDRFRGFGTVRGQILPFSIDLASRH